MVILTIFFFFPKSKVLFEKFDNALGITEIVLLQFVNLVESILQSLVSKLTSGLVVLHHFVVKH